MQPYFAVNISRHGMIEGLKLKIIVKSKMQVCLMLNEGNGIKGTPAVPQCSLLQSQQTKDL